MTLLKKIDIGVQGYFEFGAGVVRFGFMQSLTDILITPIFHRNTNKFMGIKAKDNYICYKVIKDRFMALTKTGELSIWNVVNGKLLKTVKLEGHDYSNYTLHSTKYRKNSVLLKSNAEVEGYKDEDFFMPS